VAATAISAAPAPAEEIDTEHIFGFTEGSDIGRAGDRELEVGGGGRVGARNGAYSVLGASVEGKFTLTDAWRLAPGLHFAHFRISDVPGIDDRRSTALEAVTLEVKLRILDRLTAPLGLTVGVTPYGARVDDRSGVRADVYGADVLVAADKELVPSRLFGAFNGRYEPMQPRSSGNRAWEQASALAASAALAMQIRAGVFLGGEVQYRRAHDAFSPNTLAGEAIFVGATFYARLTERLWAAGAWSIQAAGKAVGDSRSFDLSSFERQEFKVRLGYAF
jgi:hypothetical protein